jgi:hypothetical protein
MSETTRTQESRHIGGNNIGTSVMNHEPCHCTFEADGHNVFVRINGKRIAKRGQPGSLQAGRWVSIEPGWAVRDAAGEIEIMHDGIRVQ